MACDPPPIPLRSPAESVDTIVAILKKHSAARAVDLELLGRRWLALGRNAPLSSIAIKLAPMKQPAIKKRYERARDLL